MRRMRRIRMLLYLIYLLVILGAAILLYKLMPADVLTALRSTYFSDNPGGL